jgi:hypothetical protein
MSVIARTVSAREFVCGVFRIRRKRKLLTSIPPFLAKGRWVLPITLEGCRRRFRELGYFP